MYKFLLYFLLLSNFTIAQPGDPQLMILAENRNRIELLEKLEKDPHNPKLLLEKVNMDLKWLRIDLYSQPNRAGFTNSTELSSETATQLNELIALKQDAHLYFLKGKYNFYYSGISYAIEDFEKAADLAEDSNLKREINYNLSLCYYHRNEEKQAADLDKALEYIDSANTGYDPGNAPYNSEKIYFLELTKKNEELLAYYKAAAIVAFTACMEGNDITLYRFDDNFLAGLNNLYLAAAHFYKLKNYKETIGILELCISFSCKNKFDIEMPNLSIIKCHYLLSKIYRESGSEDPEKAVYHIIKASDEPKSWLINEHEMEKDLNYFLETFPNNSDLYIAKALFIYKQLWQGVEETYFMDKIDPLLEKAEQLGSQSHKIPLIRALINRKYHHNEQALYYAKEAVSRDSLNYHCQSELFEVMRNFPDTKESEFTALRNKINPLFYDKKPDFKLFIEMIKNHK
jgi:hypothetical protein